MNPILRLFYDTFSIEDEETRRGKSLYRLEGQGFSGYYIVRYISEDTFLIVSEVDINDNILVINICKRLLKIIVDKISTIQILDEDKFFKNKIEKGYTII